MSDELPLEPVGKPLRRIGRQADVLVHVECRNAGPINLRLVAKSREHITLAWRRGQDQTNVRPGTQNLAQCFADVVRSESAEFCTGFRYMNFHDVLHAPAAAKSQVLRSVGIGFAVVIRPVAPSRD